MTEQQIQSKRIKELEALGYYVIKLIKTNGCIKAIKNNVIAIALKFKSDL